MFKSIKFVDDLLRQLNEADEPEAEQPTEDAPEAEAQGAEAAGGEQAMQGGEDMGGEEMGGEELAPEDDPNAIAEVDNGTFISDLGNAEVAKTLLKAVAKAYPNEIIPPQFETVTTENADAVIKYAKNILQIDVNDQDNPYENMSYTDALNNI